MPEFLSGCVGACLGRGDSAREQSVAGRAKGRDWFEETTSAGQDNAAHRLIVIPASLFGVAAQRRRYDHMPFVHPHALAFLSQPHTRGGRHSDCRARPQGHCRTLAQASGLPPDHPRSPARDPARAGAVPLAVRLPVGRMWAAMPIERRHRFHHCIPRVLPHGIHGPLHERTGWAVWAVGILRLARLRREVAGRAPRRSRTLRLAVSPLLGRSRSNGHLETRGHCRLRGPNLAPSTVRSRCEGRAPGRPVQRVAPRYRTRRPDPPIP